MYPLDKCIGAARSAADAVYANWGPRAFTWLDALGPDIGPNALAQFVAANPDAPPEALYRFAVAGAPRAATFDKVPPALRVAVEVFRATFLVLYRLHEADRRKQDQRIAAGASIAPLTDHRRAMRRVPVLSPRGERREQADIVDVIEKHMAAEAELGGRPAKKGGTK